MNHRDNTQDADCYEDWQCIRLHDVCTRSSLRVWVKSRRRKESTCTACTACRLDFYCLPMLVRSPDILGSSMSQVILPKDFNVSRLGYAPPKYVEGGGKSILIKYDGDPLIVQTPEMALPFGIGVWKTGRSDMPDKYNLDVSFQGMDGRVSLKVFFDMLKAMETRLVTDQNSTEWFSKRYPRVGEIVEALFTPLIRTDSVKYPTFKMTLPFKDGEFELDGVYDDHKCAINLMDIVNCEGKGKGSRVRAITQCTGIWFADGKFGCTWKVKQLVIVLPATLKPYAFLRDDSVDLADADADADAEYEDVKPDMPCDIVEKVLLLLLDRISSTEASTVRRVSHMAKSVVDRTFQQKEESFSYFVGVDKDGRLNSG